MSETWTSLCRDTNLMIKIHLTYLKEVHVFYLLGATVALFVTNTKSIKSSFQ